MCRVQGDCPGVKCIAYAKRINEIQTIARSAGLTDIIIFVFTNASAAVVAGALNARNSKAQANTSRKKRRTVLVKDLAKQLLFTAGTAQLSQKEQAKVSTEFDQAGVQRILDCSLVLGADGVAILEGLGNVSWPAVQLEFHRVLGPLPTDGSVYINPLFMEHPDFDPERASPSQSKAKLSFLRNVSKLAGWHAVATRAYTPMPEDMTPAERKPVCARLLAVFYAFAAHYVMRPTNGVSETSYSKQWQDMCTNTWKLVFAGAESLVALEDPGQADQRAPYDTFKRDKDFIFSLYGQMVAVTAFPAPLAGDRVPIVNERDMWSEPIFVVMMLLAVLPLIRTGPNSLLAFV